MAGSLRILPSVACCWCHLNPEFQMTENPSHVRVESGRSHADRENHWPGWGPQGRLCRTPLGANFLCVVAVFNLPEQRVQKGFRVCVCVCVCVLTRSSPPPGSKRTDITYRGEWAGKPSLQAFGCKIHKTTEQQSGGRVKKKVFLFFLLNAASC